MLNTKLHETTQASLPNGISFQTMALAACKSVARHTNRQTDRQTTLKVSQQVELISAMPPKNQSKPVSSPAQHHSASPSEAEACHVFEHMNEALEPTDTRLLLPCWNDTRLLV